MIRSILLLLTAGTLLAVPVAADGGILSDPNLQAWFRADSIAGLADGDSVNAWADSSGNGNHASQADSNLYPKWYASPSDTTNIARPVVRFGDGTGQDYLGYDGSFLVNKPYTIMVLEGRRSARNENYFTGGTDQGGNANLILGYRNNATLTLAQFHNDLNVTVPGYTSQEFVISGFQNDGTNKYIYRDGIEKATQAAGSLLVGYPNARIGGGFRTYEGDIAEVLIFDRALSAEEQNEVGFYLENKYGLDTDYGARMHLRLEESTGAETALDSAPWGDDQSGVYEGTPTLGVTGKVGNAMQFDGSDDYIDVVDGYDPTAYTLEAWVKPADTENHGIFVRTGNSGLSQHSHELWIQGGKFEHRTHDGGSRITTGTTSVTADQWYHVVGTAINGDVLRLFVNGVEEGAPAGLGTLWTGGTRWYVGHGPSGIGLFEGVIDEPAIYDFALSRGQIRDRYLAVETDAGHDYYWDANGDDSGTGGSGTWNGTDLSWRQLSDTGALIDWPTLGADNDAHFGGTAGTVTVVGNMPVNDLTFTSANYDLTGGTLTLVEPTDGSDPPTIHTAGGNTYLRSTLAGAAGLTKTGGSTSVLYVDGDNTYTGETTVSNGFFVARHDNALGAGGAGNGSIVESGATLQLQEDGVDGTPGVIIAGEAVTLNGHGVNGNRGALASWRGNNEWTGPVTLASDSTILVNQGSFTISGAVQGDYDLTKSEVGTLILNNGGTNYTGDTTVAEGTLRLENATGFASPSTDIAAGATLDVNLTTTWNVPVMTLSGEGTLIKSGSGTMIAGGSGNTYVELEAGAVIDVQEGVLRNNNRRGKWAANKASLNVADGAQVWLYADNIYVDALTGAGTVLAEYSDTNDHLFVGVAGGSGNFAGTLGDGSRNGMLHVNKRGAGTQSFSGDSTYSGTTTVEAGTLLVNGTHSGGGAYTVQSGGTLGGIGTIGTADADVTIQSGGRLVPGASIGTLTFDLGSGTLDLSAMQPGDLEFELGTPGASDQVLLTSGTLDIGTLGLDDFTFLPEAGFGVGNYVLFDAATTILGSIDAGNAQGSVDGVQATLWIDAVNNDVVLSAVPEPSAVLLAGLGLVGLLVGRRRRC